MLLGYARIFNDPKFLLKPEERPKRYSDIIAAARSIESLIDPMLDSYVRGTAGITDEEKRVCMDALRSPLLTLINTSEVIIEGHGEIPHEEYMELRTAEDFFSAIKTLAVRGAPAIGICAGYGMYILAAQEETEDPAAFRKAMEQAGDYLISSRPTAVNLSWAVRRMLRVIGANQDKSIPEIRGLLLEESLANMTDGQIAFLEDEKPLRQWQKD